MPLKHKVYEVDKFKKREKLMEILSNVGTDRTMVFVETKKNADFLATYLCGEGLPATSIHGDRLQREREEALRDFRSGKMPIIVATGVASRGLDIKEVKHVVNYDLPKEIEEYVHRIGRTGRLGNLGKATSFYDSGRSEDQGLAPFLTKILSDATQEVPDFLAGGGSSGGASFGGGFGGKDIRSGATNAADEEDWG
jgi:probable ATP-dependent RNA helicase DDX4